MSNKDKQSRLLDTMRLLAARKLDPVTIIAICMAMMASSSTMSTRINHDRSESGKMNSIV